MKNYTHKRLRTILLKVLSTQHFLLGIRHRSTIILAHFSNQTPHLHFLHLYPRAYKFAFVPLHLLHCKAHQILHLIICKQHTFKTVNFNFIEHDFFARKLQIKFCVDSINIAIVSKIGINFKLCFFTGIREH